MQIEIHRGAIEVGGTCIEVSSSNSHILLDFGLPFSCEFGDDPESCLPRPLYTDLLTGKKKIDAVFISHAHLDHYGLTGYLPPDIPVYLSRATRTLMRFTEEFTPNKIGFVNAIEFKSYDHIQIRDLTITPFLMDHSAFDSHGFLVQDNEKSMFYTGDFRGHGLNGHLVDDLALRLPRLDALLMEGTILGEREEGYFPTEEQTQEMFYELFNRYPGPVLVTVPSQNIDRIKSLYRAARRSNRKILIDLFSAELFDRLRFYTGSLPFPEAEDTLLWYPFIQRKNLSDVQLYRIMKKHKKNKLPLSQLSKETTNPVILMKPPFRKEIENNFDLSESVWVYSMWSGYLDKSEALQRLKMWAKELSIPFQRIHTSGHAQLNDLKRLVSSLSPDMIIPVHSFHPEQYSMHFSNVCLIEDNQRVTV